MGKIKQLYHDINNVSVGRWRCGWIAVCDRSTDLPHSALTGVVGPRIPF